MKNAMMPRLVLVAAALVLIVLYYWGQNSAAQQAILIRSFSAALGLTLDVITAALIVTISSGLGRWVLLRLRLEIPYRAERVGLEAAIGLGLAGVYGLLLGLASFFSAGALWGGLLLLGLLALRSVRGWLADVRALIGRALRPQNPWQRFALIFVGGSLGLAFLQAAAPPFAWDAMTYHLEGPRRYLEAGRIAAHADNHFMGFPQALEMLYSMALGLLGRDTAVAPIQFFYGVLGLLATAGILRRHSDDDAAYTAGLILFSGYGLWWLFGIPYVDLAIMLYGASALIVLRQWRSSGDARWLIAGGLVAGFAVSVKYTGAIVAVALAVAVTLSEPRRLLRNNLLLAGVALLVFSPWMLKGIALYGNPFYPYGLDGLNWDGLRSANFNEAGKGLFYGDNWWHWFILPFAATLFGTTNVMPYAFVLGPWLLTLPFALGLVYRQLAPEARALARDALLLVLPMWGFWMATSWYSGIGAQTRLLSASWPLALVLGGLALYGIARWPRRPLDVYFLLRAMLSLTLLVAGITHLHQMAGMQSIPYHTGAMGRDQVLRLNAGALYEALQRLPEGSKVLLLWEPKAYHCAPIATCEPDLLFDRWARPLRLGLTPDALMKQWRDEDRFDYLLVAGLDEVLPGVGYRFWMEQHDFARAENELFPAALAQYTEQVWADGIAYALYGWRETPQPAD